MTTEQEYKWELVFKKYNGDVIEDIRTYVKDWNESNPYGNIVVGCDSQEHATFIKYAITICMHAMDETGLGHGAHVIYATVIDKSVNMKSDIYTKLWAESELTVQAASMIGDIGKKITIHLDYNSKEEEYSNVLYNAGIGYAKGLGFEAMGKPYAWAASHTADKIAKRAGIK